ncbi:hypothetical protein E2C01_060716 [Portunus trituberculatus]|uniref:Uncharacterized protein n=1 Tax=Portunus trituberculatus TaxID=210409 RepID=A0A5B7HBA9_PORTR|nr:hypothetical protein [Portunus trituberculatus]
MDSRRPSPLLIHSLIYPPSTSPSVRVSPSPHSYTHSLSFLPRPSSPSLAALAPSVTFALPRVAASAANTTALVSCRRQKALPLSSQRPPIIAVRDAAKVSHPHLITSA